MTPVQLAYLQMVLSLQDQVAVAEQMLRGERWIYDDTLLREHTRSDFVIGDFEIRCLHPEKYGLPPRQPEA